MVDESKVTTTRRQLAQQGELAWGGNGQPWGEAIDTNRDVTVTEEGQIKPATAVPDTVVFQQTGKTFSTGDSTWIDNVGSNDVSLTGDLQPATMSDGASAVQPDATDDYGLLTLPSEFEGTGPQSMAIELALETTEDAVVYPFGVFNNNNYPNLAMQLNRDYAENSEPGNFRFGIDAASSSRLRFGPTNSPGLNDGVRHDISIIINDSTTSDVSIIIDGSEVATSIQETDNPSNWGGWDRDMGVFASHGDGDTIGGYFSGKIGIQRWHATAITEQTITDYQ